MVFFVQLVVVVIVVIGGFYEDIEILGRGGGVVVSEKARDG